MLLNLLTSWGNFDPAAYIWVKLQNLINRTIDSKNLEDKVVLFLIKKVLIEM